MDPGADAEDAPLLLRAHPPPSNVNAADSLPVNQPMPEPLEEHKWDVYDSFEHDELSKERQRGYPRQQDGTKIEHVRDLIYALR